MEENKIVKLSDVCDLIPGFAFKSSEFGEHQTKAVKIGDIQPPYVNYASMAGVDVTKYTLSKLAKYEIHKGDFVLAMTGATIGKIGRYISNTGAYINQRVLKFKPHEDVNSDFIYYIVSSTSFQKYIFNNVDSETAQPNISAGSVGKYEFELPSLEEQNRIADILVSLDNKIQLNRQINDNLEQQAQALYKSWFVDFEPFQDGEFVESELGIIPRGWQCIQFNTFVSESKVKTGEIGIKEFSVTNNGIFPREAKYNKSLSQSSAKNKLIKCGDLVFGMSRDILNWGVMQEERGGVSSAYTVYNINSEIVNSTYLELFIKSRVYLFSDLIRPAAREGQGIDKSLLQTKLLLQPPQEVLNAFWPLYNSVTNKTQTTTTEINRLGYIRDTLLPKLMSGELKINEIDC